jgi:hypothetical protein
LHAAHRTWLLYPTFMLRKKCTLMRLRNTLKIPQRVPLLILFCTFKSLHPLSYRSTQTLSPPPQKTPTTPQQRTLTTHLFPRLRNSPSPITSLYKPFESTFSRRPTKQVRYTSVLEHNQRLKSVCSKHSRNRREIL